MVVVVALLPILAGVLVAAGGYLGWSGKLTRNRGAGVRTSATLRSDEAFALGNRVAGLPTMAAGAIGVASGLAAFAMPTDVGVIVAVLVGAAGLLGLVAAGGVLGHRAAATVPERPAAGCGGCACGAGGCAAG